MTAEKARADLTISGLRPNAQVMSGMKKGDPTMRALQISAYGDPLNILEIVDIPEPGAPGTGGS